MSDAMELSTAGDVTILRISGRFDARTVEDIKDDVKQVDMSAVAMDLSNVTFVDSSALGLIVSVFRRVQEVEGRFCLFGLSPQVMAIFELTRLHRTFDIYDDEGQALAALAG